MKLPSTLRLAGHPLHPALAHLPIGAWVAAAVWDTAAVATGDPLWWRTAYVTIALGLAAAVPASAIGFVDFLGIPAGHRAERAALWHLTVVLCSATAYLASLLVRGGTAPPTGGALAAALGLAATGLLLLAVGGWLGGELVYSHRLGLNEAPDDARAHERG